MLLIFAFKQSSTVDSKKVGLFLLIAFAISWSVVAALYFLGVENQSLWFWSAIAVLYMPAPAYATLIVARIFKQKLAAYGLEVRYLSLPWYLWSIIGVVGFILVTLLLVGLLGNFAGFEVFGTLQWTKDALVNRIVDLTEGQIQAKDVTLPLSPAWMLVAGVLGGIVAGITVNLPFALGEELGWRGLMVHETRKMGFFRANLLIGIIWGIWHAPLIFAGHNYPGYPYWGMLMMVAFTVTASYVLTYLRFKIRSVLGPAACHGMINATAGISSLYITGANPLFGSVAGLAGIAVMTVIVIWIFAADKRFIKNYTRRIQ